MLRFNSIAKAIFSILLTSLSFSHVIAQAPTQKITDFVIYGGLALPSGLTPTQPVAPGVGVQIGSSSNIKTGRTGSNRLVSTTGTVTFGDNIFSNGTVSLANSNTVNGGIIVGNTLSYNITTGNALSIGSNALVSKDIITNGNVNVAGGTINGNVIHPVGTNYVGPKIGTRDQQVPDMTNYLPAPPIAPTISKFSAGDSLISSSRILTPGSYGDIRLTGNMKLTLAGPGVFIFRSIINKNSNTISFDFQNTTTGNFQIYVLNDVDLGRGVTMMANGGNAGRIYTQVSGNGSSSANKTVAFNISNGTSNASSWLGTVWAPFGAINLGSGSGSSNITGAIWSSTQVIVQNGVNVIYSPFKDYGVIKGNDTIIIPGYTPPTGGKSYDLIGPELTSLCQYFSTNSGLMPSPEIFRIVDNYVYIEVITRVGKTDSAYQRLTSLYGFTDTLPNGTNRLLLTGKIPIANLCPMNDDATLKRLIITCRPVYPPLTKTGIIYSKGDSAIRADAVRSGYNLQGNGVRIGVLSDSYNTIPGNPAGVDVSNWDLPGDPGNPVNANPVTVLREFPYGRASDEGRAMLQIISDVAPKSTLAFRSGFLSEGDFAQGIYDLQQNGCKVITDDITYITSPFFKDGVAARAVDSVKKLGVSYFSAAGNYADKAYSAVFNPAAPPPALTGGQAHNYGGGDIYQNDSLKAGNYTIVLQWEDSVYTLGQGGALNDFDIYLANDDGTILFGMNRPNIGSDPIEVLPFFVRSDTRVNIVVVRAGGPALTTPIRFKYIIFRGNLKFNEFISEPTTLVGQANAAGAMAVGAARYTRTPAFGQTPALLETFSSFGRTPVNGVRRNKPDFVGPDGVNTSVNFYSLDIEGDGIPNFFGTSAAAPHAAGAAALILEGKKKFYNKVLEPDSVRIILGNSALDMASPGYDSLTGAGFIQADAALRSFANPTPDLDSLVLPAPNYVPGNSTFTVTIKGKYFMPSSVAYLGNAVLSTTYINSTTLTATVPPFFPYNPPVYVYTPPITPSGLDGLYSDSLHFYGKKIEVRVKADDKTKRYGEMLPVWTSTITVDGKPIDSTVFTRAELKLDTIMYNTQATSMSNVNFYKVMPGFKTLSATDSSIFQLFNFTFDYGILNITKMPLLVTPNDTTITYGDRIGGFTYSYSYPDSLINPAERDLFRNNISVAQYQNMDTSAVAFISAKAISSSTTFTTADLNNMSVMASAKAISSARTIYNAKTITSGISVNLIDLDIRSFEGYETDPNSITLYSAKTITSAKGITSAKAISSGVTVNAKTITSSTPIINSNTVGDTSNTGAIVIIDTTDVSSGDSISVIKAVNMVTGITAGDNLIVPAAIMSENFNIRYGVGKLKIKPASLTVKANDITILQGDSIPLSSTITGLKNSDSVLAGPDYVIDPQYLGNIGTYTITPGNVVLEYPESYNVTYVPGTLTVNIDPNAVPVKPSLLCVDTLINDPSGLKYVAIFQYENDNAKTEYIPLGPYNYIGLNPNYANNPPVYFEQGIDTFKIKFDGNRMVWFLQSQRAAVSSEASAATARCKKADNFVQAATRLNNEAEYKSQITPNPTTGRFIVSTDKGLMSDRDVFMSDMTGQKFTPTRINRISPSSLEINMPPSSVKGVYMLRVKVDNIYKIFRIVKL